LPREDRDAALFVYKQMVADGCKFEFNTQIESVKLIRHKNMTKDGLNLIQVNTKGKPEVDEVNEDSLFDTILFAMGR
jgi:hypothetical protein